MFLSLKRGISLIVLIITIIVMIILATVIVMSLSNNNVIDKANTAIKETNLKNMEEAANVALGEVLLENSTSTSGATNEPTIDDIIDKMKENGVSQDELEKYTITYSDGKVSVSLPSDSTDALYTLDLSQNKDGSVIANVYSDKTVISGTGNMYNVTNLRGSVYAFNLQDGKIDLLSYVIIEFYKKYNNNQLLDDFYEEDSESSGYYNVSEEYLGIVCSYFYMKDYTKDDFLNDYEEDLTNMQGSNEEDYNDLMNNYINVSNFNIMGALLKLAYYSGDVSSEQYNYFENVREHFSDLDGLIKLEIRNGITNIGNEIFACMPIESLTIPSSVENIGKNSFESCFMLINLEIPGNVTVINDEAFRSCDSLQTVQIAEGVETIGNEVFGRCDSITTVEIPSTVTSIGSWVFNDCQSLQSITVKGRSLSEIGTTVTVGKSWNVPCSSGTNSGSDVIYTKPPQ